MGDNRWLNFKNDNTISREFKSVFFSELKTLDISFHFRLLTRDLAACVVPHNTSRTKVASELSALPIVSH